MHYFFNIVKISLSNLLINKMRSALTILSMVFGTGAVIATLNSNEGAQRFIAKQLEGLGTNLLRAELKNGASFTDLDVTTINRYSDSFESSMIEATFGNQSLRFAEIISNANTFGVQSGYFDTMNITMARGRIFTPTQDKNFQTVAVLGHALKESLFGKNISIGKQVILYINQNPITFEVVGELKEKGSAGGTGVDQSVFIPLQVAKKIALSKFSLIATLKKDVDSSLAKNQINALLRPAYQDSLQTTDAKEAIEKTKGIWEKQNLLGMVLAGVTLLTGGVGIMNIMLLSIQQRRREIGLRKAIGAQPFDICVQFLVEAVSICFVGGLIGVTVGSYFGHQVAKMLGQWEAVISINTIFLALGFSSLTGVFFGIIPAIKASKMDPYEALRG